MADGPAVLPCAVTLYCEQKATVRVLAPEGSSMDLLQKLALAELDASGGAEWVTTAGWVADKVWNPDD